MTRSVSVALFTALALVGLAAPGQASGLRQTHPARLAPTVINTYAQGHFNEYPWFTYDGKLMFWTRQASATAPQKLWAVYIKNRDEVAQAPAGPNKTLPDLELGPAIGVSAINNWVRDQFVEGPGEGEIELRALAVCHEAGEELPLNQAAKNRWRYLFDLYFSARAQGEEEPGTLWRAHNLIADVDKTTFAIAIVASGLTFTEVVPQTTHPVDPSIIANETEPAFSRDSRYFFWASNAWGGTGNMAHYIGPTTQCAQLMQAPKPYSTLPTAGPGSYFPWKDQYNQTSRTNYHTLIAMNTGRSALIFEECHGQTPGSARDNWCQANNELLSTTGFTANGQPSNIVDSGWWPAGQNIHRGNGTRASHPAVSGGQNTADGSWIFFYMQGKKIYYTKLKQN